MLRIALVYGVIAGAVIIATAIASITLTGGQHLAGLQWLGYLIMLVALSLVFVGVKQHRDVALGGVIKFLPALGLGLAIALVASFIYVAVWELYLAATGHQFMERYAADMIAAKQADGLAGAALEAEIAAMEEMKALYRNPFARVGITFLEIFPVGLLVALISAALLRNPKLLPRR